MGQKIAFTQPPNYAALVARFPAAARPGVIFTYGNTIHNPSRAQIPKHIIAHEGEHGRRQEIAGVEAWWDRYLNDAFFRLDEELRAHHVEYKAALRNIGPGALRDIARRLSGPLYDHVLTYEQACHAILTGEVR